MNFGGMTETKVNGAVVERAERLVTPSTRSPGFRDLLTGASNVHCRGDDATRMTKP
jgi:hypothetical protein